jgi:hypothetical protein
MCGADAYYETYGEEGSAMCGGERVAKSGLAPPNVPRLLMRDKEIVL